jgi:hypothetical protein
MAVTKILEAKWFKNGPQQAFAAMKSYSDGTLTGYFTGDTLRRSFEQKVDTVAWESIAAQVRSLPAYMPNSEVVPYLGFIYREMGGDSPRQEYYCIPQGKIDSPEFQEVRHWFESLFEQGDKTAKH